MNYISTVDYVVFALSLVISCGIGIFYRFTGGKQSTEEEYFLGDKSAGIIPVAFSLMASFMSSITLIGLTKENYTYGTQFTIINWSYIIGTPLVAYLYFPIFFKLGCTSAYEYLENRFGKPARMLASTAFMVQMVLYMGIVLYAPAITLSAVTGISYTGSILSVGACCTFYSTMGGMKAVLIADVFQSFLMLGSIISIVIVGSLNLGGIANIWEIAGEGGRLEFFNLSVDPTARHTLWTQLIGGVFIYLSIYGVNQTQVQRLMSLGTLKKAQIALWLQFPILTIMGTSTAFTGLIVYAYYRNCDPIMDGRIKSGDQLLPLFVIETMSDYPGLVGFFVAGIFSGSLSTVSSAINSLAAVTLEDFIKPFVKIPNRFTSLVLTMLVLFYGIVSIGLAFLYDILKGGVLQASLTIFGVVGGPLLGIFSLGMFNKRSTKFGAVTAFLIALGFLFWIGFGYPKPYPPTLPVSTDECTNYNSTLTSTNVPKPGSEYFYLYRISYAWYAAIGFFITVILGSILSFIPIGKKTTKTSSTEVITNLEDPSIKYVTKV